jgi:hypothetical protein
MPVGAWMDVLVRKEQYKLSVSKKYLIIIAAK